MRTRGRRKGSRKPRIKNPTRKRGRKTRKIRGGVKRKPKDIPTNEGLTKRHELESLPHFNVPANQEWEENVFGNKNPNVQIDPGSGGGYPNQMVQSAWPNKGTNTPSKSSEQASGSSAQAANSGEETEVLPENSNSNNNHSNLELEPYVFNEVMDSFVMTPEQWTHMEKSVGMMGIPDQDIRFLQNSYATYLGLSETDPELLSRFRGYIQEFFIGTGMISSTDYNGLAILFKDFATKLCKLRYMPESFKAVYELCFIHIPRLNRVRRDQSLAMFKTILYHFFCQGTDFDRGIDKVITRMETERHPSTTTGLVLHRGVRGGNALFVSSHEVGETIRFPTAISGTIYPKAALSFTDSKREVVVLYFGDARRSLKPDARGVPQLVRGLMISASPDDPAYGGVPHSEWEILLQSGLQGVLTQIESKGGGTYYHIDVTGWYRVTDPRLVSKNIENITLDDIASLTRLYRPMEYLPGESDREQSKRFLDVHVPRGRIRYLVDHIIELAKANKDIIFSRIIPKMLRQFTIHKRRPLSTNTQPYSPNAPSGAEASSEPGLDPFK